MTWNHQHRGVVSVLAMMFIVIFSSLVAAMAVVCQGNLRSAATYEGTNRSLAAAETGMQFFAYRLDKIAQSITTDKGTIDEDQADELWPELRDRIIEEMSDELHSLEPTQLDGERITIGRIPTEYGFGPSTDPEKNFKGAPTFQVIVERHPLVGEDYGSQDYKRDPYNVGSGDNVFTEDGEPVAADNPVASYWIRVKVIGRDEPYHRSIRMDFRIDKKVRFAILSRNRIMIGRNVMIRGSLGSKYTLTDYEHGHPVQVRSNFGGLDPLLDAQLEILEDDLAQYDQDGDNRLWLADDREAEGTPNGEGDDWNSDGYVDAYDKFLARYDTDASGSLTEAEFSDTGGNMIDAQLWRLMNEVKYEAGTEFDWDNKRVLPPGGVWTDATADFESVDELDGYAKIAGRIVLAADKEGWETGAAGGSYQHFLEDSIHPDPDDDALVFEADDSMLAEFPPEAFDVSSYKAMAGGSFVGQVAAANRNDPSLPAAYTPPSQATTESVPYQSPHPYDYYARPVYENMVFTDVLIPKGTNALFNNCKFVGVTFVDTETANAHGNYNYAGMQNPDGSMKYVNLTAEVNGSDVADTKPLSNNIRFNNCTFEGIVVTEASAGYAHVRNKLQFTGRVEFDLDAPSLTADRQELFRKSTIMAPQYSVDMGTFVDPTATDEVVTLDGTIVAGVFDIRGQATIDGAIITTYEPTPDSGPLFYGGNPAGFNTTLGYFESAAGDSEGEIPPGGWGKVIIRYDPDRAMPDGIIGSIEVKQNNDTYAEGG